MTDPTPNTSPDQPTDTVGLVERLNLLANSRPSQRSHDAMDDAMRAERDTARQQLAEARTAAPALDAEAVARLREALGDMMALFSADGLMRRGAEVNAALALARAALSASPATGDKG